MRPALSLRSAAHRPPRRLTTLSPRTRPVTGGGTATDGTATDGTATDATAGSTLLTGEPASLSFLAARSAALGLRPLDLQARALAIQEASGRTDGLMRPAEWKRLVGRTAFAHHERRVLSEFVAKAHGQHLGQQLLRGTALLGVCFFSASGSHAAGEAGMHAVGALLVGAVTGLGGGTVNNVVVGATPVGWMRDTAFLKAALLAGLLGFYAWPLVERQLGCGGAAAEGVRFGVESAALGALAVVGAQQGIVRGLSPLVSACFGVTITLGGVMRDVLCQRELRLGDLDGCQSYALASFCGGAVYVGLRELHVWNCAGSTHKLVAGGLPIGLRIALGASTAIAVRAFAWQRRPEGLLSGMDECADANERWLRVLFGGGASADGER